MNNQDNIENGFNNYCEDMVEKYNNDLTEEEKSYTSPYTVESLKDTYGEDELLKNYLQ